MRSGFQVVRIARKRRMIPSPARRRRSVVLIFFEAFPVDDCVSFLEIVRKIKPKIKARIYIMTINPQPIGERIKPIGDVFKTLKNVNIVYIYE